MNRIIVAAAIFSVVSTASARAADGMWYIGVDMCGTGPNSAQCVNGLMVRQNSPRYVSREQCERGAQDFLEEMRSVLMNVKRVWCEERTAAQLPK